MDDIREKGIQYAMSQGYSREIAEAGWEYFKNHPYGKLMLATIAESREYRASMKKRFDRFIVLSDKTDAELDEILKKY